MRIVERLLACRCGAWDAGSLQTQARWSFYLRLLRPTAEYTGQGVLKGLRDQVELPGRVMLCFSAVAVCFCRVVCSTLGCRPGLAWPVRRIWLGRASATSPHDGCDQGKRKAN